MVSSSTDTYLQIANYHIHIYLLQMVSFPIDKYLQMASSR